MTMLSVAHADVMELLLVSVDTKSESGLSAELEEMTFIPSMRCRFELEARHSSLSLIPDSFSDAVVLEPPLLASERRKMRRKAGSEG